jgi:alanine racemase
VTSTVADAAARAWVEVDLGALVANARAVVARAERPLLAMVKANGYGLGAVAVARALEAVAPWGYGVATPEEGAELRAAAIVRPIVVFTPLRPAWIPYLLRHDLRPAIGDPTALRAWLSAAGERPFHIELDTGMSRAGFKASDRAALGELAELLRPASGWEGVFTHFHSADTDLGSAADQWSRFETALGALPRRASLVHAANSAACMRDVHYAADLVRPGVFLYGGSAGHDTAPPRPVARLAARVVAVRRLVAGETASYGAEWRASRPTHVATLGIGYADGVLRSLGGRGVVEIGGRIVPIVGRITMDMTMIDVGDDPVQPGAIATIFGGALSLVEQAARAGTIEYELLTAIGHRVERRYTAGA